jgi:hypothetical protein
MSIKGVNILTINDIKSNYFSLENLPENQDGVSYSDSLGVLVSDSHIIIATEDSPGDGRFKSRIQLIKKPIADI